MPDSCRRPPTKSPVPLLIAAGPYRPTRPSTTALVVVSGAVRRTESTDSLRRPGGIARTGLVAGKGGDRRTEPSTSRFREPLALSSEARDA